MSYENAPATRMLASHCAVCGRPLVDAVSVETGVGPDCRKRYGYARADRAVDFGQVLESFDASVRNVVRDARDAHAAANKLVWWIAMQASDGEDLASSRYVNAVHELGFDKLSARIMRRLATVEITVNEAGDAYLVKSPYSELAVEQWRQLGRSLGRRLWDGKQKANVVPVTARRALWETLIRLYPGQAAVVPDGRLVTIPGGR